MRGLLAIGLVAFGLQADFSAAEFSWPAPPKPPSDKVMEGEANRLSVTLVVDKGVWKFDKATDLGARS